MSRILGQIYKRPDGSWGGGSVKYPGPGNDGMTANELGIYVITPDRESLNNLMDEFRTVYKRHVDQWEKDGKASRD